MPAGFPASGTGSLTGAPPGQGPDYPSSPEAAQGTTTHRGTGCRTVPSQDRLDQVGLQGEAGEVATARQCSLSATQALPGRTRTPLDTSHRLPACSARATTSAKPRCADATSPASSRLCARLRLQTRAVSQARPRRGSGMAAVAGSRQNHSSDPGGARRWPARHRPSTQGIIVGIGSQRGLPL